jgi:hypothetical protein
MSSLFNRRLSGNGIFNMPVYRKRRANLIGNAYKPIDTFCGLWDTVVSSMSDSMTMEREVADIRQALKSAIDTWPVQVLFAVQEFALFETQQLKRPH